MTTIAYRDGLMAADSHVNGDGIRQGSITKIGRNSAGDLIGVCGSASLVQKLLSAFASGDESHEIKEGQGEALIARATGTIEFWDYHGHYQLGARYAATGSGFQIALGAMAFGASAEQAVTCAAQHDTSTGGLIHTLRLEV